MFRNNFTLSLSLFCISSMVYAEAPIAVPINYDAISFIEEPLALEAGKVTLSTNGLIDKSYKYDIIEQKRDEIDDFNVRAIASLRASTQLPNSWDLDLEYVANYNRLRNDEYTDTASIAVSDEWGTLALGNVTGSVFETSRRRRGVGNAELPHGNFIGELDQDGLFYSVRFNMVQLSATADSQGNFETGINFAQPIGQSQYFSSLRVRKAHTENNAVFEESAETMGAAWVGGYYYASYLIDAQVGYESVDLDHSQEKNDHFFASLGGQYKYGAYAFSLEGGLRRYDGENTPSAAFGTSLDVARGLSLNIGVNYLHMNDDDFAEAVSSIRYQF